MGWIAIAVMLLLIFGILKLAFDRENRWYDS